MSFVVGVARPAGSEHVRDWIFTGGQVTPGSRKKSQHCEVNEGEMDGK